MIQNLKTQYTQQKKTKFYIQSQACNPSHYTIIRLSRVTRILDMFKITNPRKTMI